MNATHKKIFMFANYTPADKSIGITKKICSEINTLRRLGYSVYYSAYDTDGVSIFNQRDEVILHKKYPLKSDKMNRLIRYFWLERMAVAFLKEDHNFALGYIRLGPPNSMLFKILDLLKSGGAHIVAEAHGYFPGFQYHNIRGKYTQFMHRVNHNKFKRYLDYFLVEGNLKEMYGVPCYTVKIGVDVKNIVPHKYCGAASELNLICVSNETIYHAYDRIIKSLYEYGKKNTGRTVKIHLVGTVTDQTRRLIENLQLSEYVILYGKKSGEELDWIYNKCNIGLGPLGQHRVGGKKDTGLKTKEYFAKGLPYIYSGEEPSVPESYPYIMQVPSDESSIDFDEVWKFYESFSHNEHVVEEMRKFALDNYSWDEIMTEALSHINWRRS